MTDNDEWLPATDEQHADRIGKRIISFLNTER